MSTPVRIYVLHHPDSKLDEGLAAGLTSRIYDWFRLPNLEGIPVYLRSAPAPGSDRPALPARKPGEQCLEYIVPLVDAHMVRDPVWHSYLADIAQRCILSEAEGTPEWGQKMFPVALDGTAFNLPDGIARMNFIRHAASAPRFIVTPEVDDAEDQRAKKAAQEAELAEETLKHLTEAIARDLSTRLFPHQTAERFKIFISYARADSTEQAKALRTYIQGQTQCLVFFDENDIGFGSAFEDSIDGNVSHYSKALIVLNSDSYAERPWCRREIGRFTRSRTLPLKPGTTPPQHTSQKHPASESQHPAASDEHPPSSPQIHVFLPVLVVDNMAGPTISRVVPELAQALVVRWAPDRERLYFSALMREVVLSLRAVLEARTMKWDDLGSAVIVNRLPGPVALARLLPGGISTQQHGQPFTVHHPGYGLPFVEQRLLEEIFSKVTFHAFRDITRYLPGYMGTAVTAMEHLRHGKAPLSQKVIAISTAYESDDLAKVGYLPQHQDEALIYLLRPLVRLGADLLYGGRPPKRRMESSTTSTSRRNDRNITLTLMQLLSAERSHVDNTHSAHSRTASDRTKPLLFNISSWPACDRISQVDEASWINACHVERIRPQDVGLPRWTKPIPQKNEEMPAHFRRHRALTFSRMRQMLADGFTCKTPGNLHRTVRPAAFIFVGGVLDTFKAKGVMPGVMEEFLRAAQARPPIPIYLIGGLGGATGVIARALTTPSAQPPSELTQQHYTRPEAPNHAAYNALLKDLSAKERRQVRQQFTQLWQLIKAHHRKNGLDQLFANGLTDAENRTLLTTHITVQAVGLIWQGLTRTLLTETNEHEKGKGDKSKPKAKTPPKPKPKTTTRKLPKS